MHINTINNINDSHKQLFIIQVYAGNCMNNIVLKHFSKCCICLAWPGHSCVRFITIMFIPFIDFNLSAVYRLDVLLVFCCIIHIHALGLRH